ncbi:Nlpc/p60 superfamily protein, partial [Monkeypox virus]
GVR